MLQNQVWLSFMQYMFYKTDGYVDLLPNGPLLSHIRKSLSNIQYPQFTIDTTLRLSGSVQLGPDTDSLNFLVSALQKTNGSDVSKLVQVSEHWQCLEQGLSAAIALELQTCILRAQSLIGHWAIWMFLSQAVPATVDICLQGPEVHHQATHPWILRLVMFLVKLHNKDRHAVKVSFAEVYSGLEILHPFPEASLGYSKPALLVGSPDKFRRHLVACTQSVLAQWLRLRGGSSSLTPYRERWDIQGCILDAIFSLEHPGLLLLPSIFNIFTFSRYNSLSKEEAPAVTSTLTKFIQQNSLKVTELDAIFHMHFPLDVPITSQGLWTSEVGLDFLASLELEDSPQSAPAIAGPSSNTLQVDNSVMDKIAQLTVQFLQDLQPTWNQTGYSYQSTLPDTTFDVSVFVFQYQYIYPISV